MKLQLLNRNITLVYDSLDLGLVSADKIRQALGIGASLGMQPDGIVALVPEQSCIVQLANKRLSVTSSKPVEEIADKFITNLTMSLHDAIPSDRAKLLAYGLNYEIVVPAADPNVRQRMLETLLGDIDAINEILGGKLVSARPTLLFLRKGVPHELTVEPSDDEHLKF